MLKKLSTIVTNLIHSLDNRQNVGWSARKLTALFGVLMGAFITAYKLPSEAQLHALYAWLLIALLCLGIVTVEQIIKIKNGNEKPTETNNNDSNSNPIN